MRDVRLSQLPHKIGMNKIADIKKAALAAADWLVHEWLHCKTTSMREPIRLPF